MKRLAFSGLALAAAVLAAVVAFVWGVSPDPQPDEKGLEDAGARGTERSAETSLPSAGRDVIGVPKSQEDADSPDRDSEDEAEPLSEEEKREAEQERLVEAFDGLTDRWMEPSPKGVTMSDVDNFAKAFRMIPKERQDECIHRALNLIPDENVMLLAGVLMDKEMDKEIVETVYNDILNRDEDVKKPILQQIFRDKEHPCWADTAWILDVTDELPKSK